MKKTASFEDFKRLDFRVGKVIKAEDISGAKSLIRLTVDFGKIGKRIILSGIKKWYQTKDLEGKNYIFVVNLEPKKMMGEESQGMILAAEDEKSENCILLIPEKETSPGVKVH